MQEKDSFETSATPWVVSLVANAKATITRNADAAEIINDIRTGKWRKPVEEIRAEFSRVLTQTGDLNAGKAAVSILKKKLPGVMPSGQFSSRAKPTAEKLQLHSGLLCADLDHLGERLECVRNKLKSSPHLWAMFISPTGTGLKCWFRVPPDGERHAASFCAVQEHVRHLTGEELDKACCDVARLCFVSFDPKALLNTGAVELLTAPTHIRLTPASESCISALLPDCVTASLHNNASLVLGNITARNDAQRALNASRPQLAKLYTAMIEGRFLALPHTRNEFLTHAIPFLYRAVGEHLILALVGHFYDCNRALFNDGREQHMEEAKAMLESVVKTYAESLNMAERAIYNALTNEERDMFRICRDLALLPEPVREQFAFFGSFDHFALRMGLNHPMQALRIVRRMEGLGLIKPLTKGTRRGPGAKAVAGTYKWLLSSLQEVNNSPNQTHD